jgi:hypothetical protein
MIFGSSTSVNSTTGAHPPNIVCTLTRSTPGLSTCDRLNIHQVSPMHPLEEHIKTVL